METQNSLALLGPIQEHPHLKVVAILDIVVPDDYDHDTRLTKFGKAHRKEFYDYNDAITDKNYAGIASVKLTPGRKFKVKVIQIQKTVTPDDCLHYLDKHGGILVGAQGASLVCEQAKDKLPAAGGYVSFDKKDALGQDTRGRPMLPFVGTSMLEGGFEFSCTPFAHELGIGFYLLCFLDER
jgi:hypothetical protein